MKRRRLLLSAVALSMPGAAAPKLPDGTVDEQNAKLTKEPFGDLRIYYDGPTDQLKSMTAGSLRLNPGLNRIRLISTRKRSSCSLRKEAAR